MSGPGATFESFSRSEWSSLARPTSGRCDVDLAGTTGAGVPMDPDEILEVYRPLCLLIELLMASARTTASAVDGFLDRPSSSPFVVGIAGGVAVGKSTTAQVIRSLLGRGPGRPSVELLGTDAYLFPNHVLEARGLMARKGFPETFDHAALVDTLASIRTGAPEVVVPVYSHEAYDVLAGAHRSIVRPDVVIVEGVNVLQTGPADAEGRPAVADFVDVVVYIDASEHDAGRWFGERLLGLRSASTAPDPAVVDSAFHRWLCSLSEEEARRVADDTWSEVNLVNLRRHVAPSRERAHVVLRKDARHRVDRVRVRRP